MEGSQHVSMLRTIKVALVQDYGCWDIVHLAGDKKSVKERQLHLRVVDCDDKESTVHVSRDDVRLAGKVGRFSDDIVAAGLDRSDHSRIFSCDNLRHRSILHILCDLCLVHHDISYSHWICGIASLQTYFTSEHSREQVPVRKSRKQIVASRMFYNRCFSLYQHILIYFSNHAKIMKIHFYH